MNFELPADARRCTDTYIVNVTPKLAREWLSRNIFNRPINQDLVQMYVQQIENDLWRLTHQGCGFTTFGSLLDGQHRLTAIIITGKTLPMRVTINQPEENFEFIDNGRNRSNLETMRMGQRDQTLNSAHSNVLKAFLAGRSCKTTNQWSSAELNIAYDRYKKPVEFVVDLFHGNKDKWISTPTVLGVISRAFCYTTAERIREFVLLLTNSTEPQTESITVLREFLRNCRDHRENTKREIYRQVQMVLYTFIYGDERKTYSISTPDLFPLTSPK